MNQPVSSPQSPAPNAAKSVRPSTGERSFASLNFLRGLSAAGVLFSHTAASLDGEKPLVPFNWGSLAVDVFMLISGFLMMWHFYERRNLGEIWGTTQTSLKFYTRRFFRIAPLYYVLLVIVYVFHANLLQMDAQNKSTFHAGAVANLHDPISQELTAGEVVSHFTFAFGFIPRYASSSPLPDWSIGLEMQFYLFFPFLAILLVRTRFIGGTILLLACGWVSLKLFGVGVNAAPKLLGAFPMPTLLPFKIACFLVGMLLAAGLYEKENGLKRAFIVLLGLLVAGLYMKKFLLIATAFAVYELAVMGGTGLPRFNQLVKRGSWIIENRIFKFMADASYGVYLIHIPLLMVVVWLLVHYTRFVELSPVGRLLVCLAVIIPIVYGLAFLTFKYIESPGIAWGRKIIKKISVGGGKPA